MTTKQTLFLVLALAISGCYFYFNRDWFQASPIQIYHRLLPAGRFASPDSPAAETTRVSFGFNRLLKLTGIRVFAVDEAATNQFPHLLWQMTADKRSVPTKGFVYGGEVPGMHAAFTNTAAEPLAAGVKYRLEIREGSHKAEHDFSLGETDP
jgi:hypothetical protein